MTGNLKSRLESFLKPEQISESEEKNKAYASDWTRTQKAVPKFVLFPQSTDDVVRIVKLANELKCKLVPSGGRTGLAGAVSVLGDELVVSMEKMNRILEHDPIDNLVRCESGVITQVLQEYVKSKGAMLPLDLGARGSCQIGGNVASNAGGVNVIRNGMIRQWVAGLRVVTGSGEELNLQANLVKDNSGYNMIQPFIGSEGTLGIITEVSLWLTNPPIDSKVVSFCCDDLASTLQTYVKLRDVLPLQAFEIFDRASYDLVLRSFPDMKPIFPRDKTVYAVIEFEGVHGWDETLSGILAELPAKDIAETAIIAETEPEKLRLWSYREKIAEAGMRAQHYQTDVSVRTSRIFDFVRKLSADAAREVPELEFFWFGHLGDGNAHIAGLRRPDSTQEAFNEGVKKLSQLTLRVLKEFNGSFSAEHGVGILKKPHMKAMKTPYELEYHKKLKAIFDPGSVLNPGKIQD